MTFEILVYCPTRELFIQGMTTTTLPDGQALATFDEESNTLIPTNGVQMDEIGPITKYGPPDADGNPTTTTVPGHHVNFRVYGDLAAMLTQGLPQINSDGTPISLFERTHILDLIPGLEWKPITQAGVPAGYEGPNGVRLFDPAVVNNRARVWV